MDQNFHDCVEFNKNEKSFQNNLKIDQNLHNYIKFGQNLPKKNVKIEKKVVKTT